MNRLGIGLALGAGYVLGRTRKMKLALAVGSMVAGRQLPLSPRAVADLVSGQLQGSPEVKELTDEVRGELSGVGKAASGALIERQVESLADRLHGRTEQIREELEDTAPREEGNGEEEEDRGPRDEEDRRPGDEDEESGAQESRPSRPRTKASGRKPAAKQTASKQRTTKQGPAKKPAAKRAPAKKSSARRTTKTRASSGGGGDD
ncbi:DNA primase [Streptomyces sp. NPDC046821]|uniref:DNA primase n=1 Tax=Streptomyces sp. NPDC046821 TaxID=3154702 RepID=UPI0033C342E3